MVSGQSKIGPSQLLAQLRKAGNNKLCDVELVVEGRKEYVHSAVIAVHSKLLYRLINTEQSPPFSYDLHRFSYDSVRSVIDWMYFGEAKFSSDICSHLAVTAYFEVAELHSILEQQLVRLAMNPSSLPLALDACADDKTRVSPSTCSLIVDCLASSSYRNPPLTTKTAKYLLVREETTLSKKARVVTLVLKWLALYRDQAATVLEYIQNVELSETDERALINRLASMVKNKEDVRVEVDGNNRLSVVSGLAAPRSEREKDLVSMASIASPAQSEMEVHQHIAYSPLRSMKRELDKLPDVFKQNAPAKRKESRSSGYPQYVERPSGYIPPSFRGKVGMDVQLSTTSTPAFAAYTAAPPLPSAAARPSSSNTNSYSYNEPVGAAFTAESIAEMRTLPDLFARKPSQYSTPQKTLQHQATPSRHVSSVYAQAAPYGPSYTEGQTVQPQPFVQQKQQPMQHMEQQSVPMPVKLELPGGAVVIPHAAHPMLPYSQPYVEVRLPNQPMYAGSNFTEYSQTGYKNSEYAGQF
ncbi:hypothetical protein PMAYCL1PPCAC_18690 [Pristionchus mayeri]|uniref:BTB domain-containing protein n=1 Tax=Pristionchus mayeri TaxID=1317129 RepID=A0AAN5I1W3_9BILA|nr:hypothetical protein PMAYCL1PPCAC_18690 [Pristionchus mayeri]